MTVTNAGSTDRSPVPSDARFAPRPMWRARILAACVVLVTIAFLQDPGRVAADTKLDLTVSPWRLLGRALHLWDGEGFFGQLQNQAYGYLWPMGPFFGLGQSVGLPPWVVQRLWWSVVLVTAFLGLYKLSGLLGIGRHWPRLIAAFGFALAVRPQSGLGAISVEIWPMAVAPWVLVPLVAGARRGSPVRAAALSALAVATIGGVNAVAAGATLPLALWWLLLLSPGPRRRRLLGWWLTCVALAITWWIVPLALLGRYSPPFLDWIESATYTTSITDPVTVLRGASHWVAYLGEASQWSAGRLLALEPLMIVVTGVVAAAGVAGLAARGLPHRTFLLGGALAGLALVSLGHTGVTGGLGSEQVRDLLDGPLSPIRNVHKFDLVLRIPLMLAFCHVLSLLWPEGRTRWPRRMAAGGLVAALAVTTWPAWSGQLARDRTYQAMSGDWREADAWLADHGAAGRALIVPGASFADYVWGRTQDEPMQSLGGYPWGVRDAVPLSSAGNIRMLDAVEARLETGRPSPGLAPYLARMGVRYLVVRNDLDPATGAPRAGVVHQALDRSPGFARVARFGFNQTPPAAPGVVSDEGLNLPYPAVEVFEVRASNEPADRRVLLRPADNLMTVQGAPEAQLALADLGLLGNAPVVVAGDPLGVGVAGRLSVATDTDRRREVTFGVMRGNESATLTADQGFVQRRLVHDYRVDGQDPSIVAPAVEGVRVTANSSAADVGAVDRWPRGATAWAALDGNPATYWRPGAPADGGGHFWEVDYDEVVNLPSLLPVRLLAGTGRGRVAVPLVVETDTGQRRVDASATSRRQDLPVSPGPTRRVRISLASNADDRATRAFGLREVSVPGATVRGLTVPVGMGSDAVLFTARPGDAQPCMIRDGGVLCSPVLAGFSEDRPGIVREVETVEPMRTRPSLLVQPYGPRVAGLVAQASGVDVTASSTRTEAVAGSALMAFDRNVGTAWQAAPDDERPRLTIGLPEQRRLRGVRLVNRPGLNASSPLEITVTAGGQAVRGFPDERGLLLFPEVTTDRVEIAVERVNGTRNRVAGREEVLPVGLSEVALLGGDDLRVPLDGDTAVRSRCGDGPDVTIDGRRVARTQVETRVGVLLAGDPVPAVLCGGQEVVLPAGRHRVEVRGGDMFFPLVVGFPTTEGLTAATGRPVSPTVDDWGATARTVQIPPSDGEQVLEVTENFNPGWEAAIDGTGLEPIRLEGWKQGFVVPAGVGGRAALEYRPDTAYRLGLAAGLLAVLMVIWLAVRAPGGRDDAPVLTRTLPRTGAGLAALSTVLVTGWWGALAFGLAWLLLRRTTRLALAGGVCAGLAVCAQAASTHPPGVPATAAQSLLVAASLAVLGRAALRDAGVDAHSEPHASTAARGAR